MNPPTDWANLRAEYAERAAIAQYDGGLSREEAERLAAREIYDACVAATGRAIPLRHETLAP